MLPSQMSSAQQYNVSAKGYAPLQRWAEDHIRQMHAPPSPHDVLITTGSNHAVDVRLRGGFSCDVVLLSLEQPTPGPQAWPS